MLKLTPKKIKLQNKLYHTSYFIQIITNKSLFHCLDQGYKRESSLRFQKYFKQGFHSDIRFNCSVSIFKLCHDFCHSLTWNFLSTDYV